MQVGTIVESAVPKFRRPWTMVRALRNDFLTHFDAIAVGGGQKTIFNTTNHRGDE